MTYKLVKRLIDLGNYDKEDMIYKLDVFLLNDRISQEEYEELIALMDDED